MRTSPDGARPFQSPAVAVVFDACPPNIRRKLMMLRRLIFDAAAATEGIGELEETLKWGEPAYVTSRSRSGSTVRIAWKKSRPTQYAMYFHCQTNLIDCFRGWFPNDFTFEGNRALIFEAGEPVPVEALTVCITAALTYHRDKGPAPRGGRAPTRPR